jgi:hypothetical protein
MTLETLTTVALIILSVLMITTFVQFRYDLRNLFINGEKFEANETATDFVRDEDREEIILQLKLLDELLNEEILMLSRLDTKKLNEGRMVEFKRYLSMFNQSSKKQHTAYRILKKVAS